MNEWMDWSEFRWLILVLAAALGFVLGWDSRTDLQRRRDLIASVQARLRREGRDDDGV